ncbi:MAG: InlB B-repeat-containing protein [Clostridia bacterium]|nr:InlB B-repeat-containing protein [Clostridia bacterium]
MKKTQRFLAFFLALLMLIPLTAFAKPPVAQGEYVRNKILSAADLLGLLSDASAGEAERNFLDRFYEVEIRYNAAVPGGLISVSGGAATAGGGYTTKAEDGRTITWNPQGSVLLKDGVATVSYKGALTVPKADANALLNYVYGQAVLAKAAEDEIAAYNKQLNDHNTYAALKKQYDKDVASYEKYTKWKNSIYKSWETKYLANKDAWDKYDAYQAALTKYNADKAAYDTDYAAWLKEKEQYPKDKEAYNQYLINQGKIDLALRPIESMFIDYGFWNGSKYGLDDQIGVRSLYEALQNEDLVAMLLQYQDKLCAATSLTRAEFQALKKTSDELNAMLRQYAEKREVSQKEAFLYYKANYVSIRDKFNHLYDEMTVILKPTVYTLMCAAIDEEYGNLAPYKKWRIKNVLCQIYMASRCIDDASTRSAKWFFYADDGDEHEYLYADLINQAQIIEDLNQSDPSALAWKDNPGVPFLRNEPVAPKLTAEYAPKPTDERMDASSAPKYPYGAVPSEPGTPPTYVEKPSAVAQDRYDTVARCAEILVAYKAGEIVRRTEYTSDAVAYLSETVSRRYDPATGNSSESVYNEKGELSSESEVATEWSGEGKTYVLLGFLEDHDGLCYYPIYEEEDLVFDVVFRSEGQEILRQKYAYGQTPSPNVIPRKASTNTHTYTFSGWDPVLSLVKGDAVYDARFTEEERLYTITFLYREKEGTTVKDVQLTETHPWGATLMAPITEPSYIDGVYLYEFIGWNGEIVPVSGNAVYAVQYRKTPLVIDPDDPEGDEPEIDVPETEPPETESAEDRDTESVGESSEADTESAEAGTNPDREETTESLPDESMDTESDEAEESTDRESATDSEGSIDSVTDEEESESETESETQGGTSGSKPSISIDDSEYGKYIVHSEANAINCKTLITVANLQDKTLTFDFSKSGITLDVSKEAVDAFLTSGVAKIELLISEETNEIGIALYDSHEERVYPKGHMTLRIPVETLNEGRICLRKYYSDGSFENLEHITATGGAFTFDADVSFTYGTVRYYTVTVKMDGEEPRVYEAVAGTWFPLHLEPPTGKKIDSMILVKVGETKENKLDTTDGFAMPDCNVELIVTYSDILYRIEFRYRGGTDVKMYKEGETIQIPTIPMTVTENGVVYTFNGWNIAVHKDERALGDRVYEAQYVVLSEEEAADKGDEGAMRGVWRYWILPYGSLALGVIAVLTVGIILTVKLVKKRKKKSK